MATTATLPDALLAYAESHPTTKDFLERYTSSKLTRNVLHFAPDVLSFNLTQATLVGPGLLSAEPIVYADHATGACLVLMELGERLAGHKGIVHGGIPGVILDEVMGRACFPLFKAKIGVTGKLELRYKAPIQAGSKVFVKAIVREQSGRKAVVDGWVISAEDDVVCVEAEGLFIEPKWADQMSPCLPE